MAKTTKEKPNQGTQKETPIEGNAPGGVSFRDLINYSTGSSAPSAEQFESAMAARGYRSSDVRKLKKAFNKVNASGKDYYLRNSGFDVYQDGARETGSGQQKGNKKGLDLGDLVGLGNDVSLLAGALRNELPGYEKAEANAVNQIGRDVEQGVQNAIGSVNIPDEASPEKAMTEKMNSLSKQANPGKKGGGKGKGGAQAKDNFKPGDIFQPDWDLLNWSPLGNQNPQQAETPNSINNAQSIDDGEKPSRGSSLDSFSNFDFFWKTNPGYVTSELGSNIKDAATTGMFALPLIGGLAKQSPATSKFVNRFLTPASLMGLGLEITGDAFDPEKDVDWGQAATDAGEIALMGLLNKYNAGKPQKLPSVATKAAKGATKFSKAAQAAGKKMAENIKWPAVETSPAGLLPPYVPKLGTWGEAAPAFSAFEYGGKIPRSRRAITKFS